MQEAKEACERALEAKVIPAEVVTECLSIREGRREHEVRKRKLFKGNKNNSGKRRVAC